MDLHTCPFSGQESPMLGKLQVVVGSIKACGVGFTLTRSSNVIFAELDWTPASMAQAEDRTHRIGQKNAVLVKMLVFDGSIDAMLAKKLVEKEEIIEAVLA
jgi:SWI/SNF-related matrix-associated actin-dependent regulator 1 of chromatin subfamily A